MTTKGCHYDGTVLLAPFGWRWGALACAVVASGAAAGPAAATSPASEPASDPPSTPACATGAAADVAYESIPGVDPNLLSLDVSPVAGDCDAPVAVWVHGGGWRVGDKADGQAVRATFYNAQGWVLVSVNYRLSVSGAEPRVVYPDHNNDVAAALAWVDDHIADYGGDPSRVMLVGYSAGAGIAAAVMADPAYLDAHGLDPATLDCVVMLDTEGYDVAAMAATSEVYRNAFGDDPAVWAAASPSTHVDEGPLPARALVVTRGTARRTAKAAAFADQLAAAGVDARVVDVNPLSHAEVNRLIGSGDDVMTPLMTDELATCEAP